MARTVPKIVPARVDLHTCTDDFLDYWSTCRCGGKIVKLLNLGWKRWRARRDLNP